MSMDFGGGAPVRRMAPPGGGRATVGDCVNEMSLLSSRLRVLFRRLEQHGHVAVRFCGRGTLAGQTP